MEINCKKCNLIESELRETVLTCDCKKGGRHDLDRAFSKVQKFLNGNNFSDNYGDFLDSLASEDHSS